MANANDSKWVMPIDELSDMQSYLKITSILKNGGRKLRRRPMARAIKEQL